mgnify:CR=1 FL=1
MVALLQWIDRRATILDTNAGAVRLWLIAVVAAGAAAVVLLVALGLGIVLLETQGARQIDLDPECVLFGSLESLFAVDSGRGWIASPAKACASPAPTATPPSVRRPGSR